MGQITAKSGKGLVNTGILFSNYLQGKNQTLQVTGDSVVTEAQGGEVSWLTKAFKTLTLDVILPGSSLFAQLADRKREPCYPALTQAFLSSFLFFSLIHFQV